MIEKIFYLCDGKVPRCMEKNGGKGSPGCYRNGGDCKHTSDPEHAINFITHGSSNMLWEGSRKKGIMSYKEYIRDMKKEWIGKIVRFQGEEYEVVDVDYNGGLLIDKKAEFTDTTAVDPTQLDK